MVFLAPPCSSWSRARRGPKTGGPPPALRDSQHILGFPHLAGRDLQCVAAGNRCMRFCARMLRECAKHSIPAGMENPRSSMIWLAMPLRGVIAATWSEDVFVDHCQWGTRWRKPTRLLMICCANLDRLQRRCHPTGRVCSYSGREHLTVSGINPDTKKFWTSHAQEYPRGFSNDVACALHDTCSSRVMRQVASMVREIK